MELNHFTGYMSVTLVVIFFFSFENLFVKSIKDFKLINIYSQV